MSLELINTIASLTTAGVIGATAIAAIVQLRHMRMGNQINALLALQNELDSKEFRDAEALMRRRLPAALDDPEFCAYCIAVGRREEPEVGQEHRELREALNLIGNTYENLGALVKNGIVDRRLFLDVYSWIVAGAWERLEGYVAISRAASGMESIFENFEYIAEISLRYLAAHPVTYPVGMPRLDPQLPKNARDLLARPIRR